ncbi:MAG: hypothetical protein GOMPHAMPRED_002125 [Gomphillus americanus]|uniref:Glycoprotease family protein n=1 Tax=Gomphillus americanus TaxID=1940652 RepID=A0A8H3FBW1_9LECA|nr:MAG: hypothetical protein GOMPHAMPRED_002125 [Gomphillus americanus]
MSTTQDERARRASPNSSTKAFATSTDILVKRQVNRITEMHNLQQDQQSISQTARLNLPSLNVITNFSRHKQAPLHRQGPSIQERRQKRDPSPVGMHPISALSPSDRTLVIGISPQISSIHHIQHDGPRSVAPEIVIIPIKSPTNRPWKQKDWRPRSSIYSQMTRLSRALSVGQIPPVPPLPLQGQYPIKARPMSAVSWHTDFSEDDEKEIIRRSFSNENQLGNTRELNNRASHRRSEGWWNTMLSPIFGRSNTVSKKTGHALSAEEPRTPWTQQLPQHELTINNGQTTNFGNIWEGLDQIDTQRQTVAFFNHSPFGSKKSASIVREAPITPEVVQERGFGLASEYYEASWHDAYSPTQFFICQGHDCSQKVAYKHGKTIGGPDAGTPLPELTEKNLASIQYAINNNSGDLEQSKINTRDITARDRPATPVHTRNVSGETIIENEPDAKSQVDINEVRPVLSSTASSPMRRIRNTPNSGKRPIAKAVDSSTKTSTGVSLDGRTTENLSRFQNSRQRQYTPQPVSVSVRSGQPLSQSPLKAPSSRKAATPAHTITANSALEDPFHDIYRCDSPETFTQEWRKEVVQQKTAPKAPSTIATPPSIVGAKELATRHDVLNIEVPRKAPPPPRNGSLQNPSYTQPHGSKSALGILVDKNAGTERGQNESEPVQASVPDPEKVFNRQENQFMRSNTGLVVSTQKPEQSSKALENEKDEKKRGGFLVCCLSGRNKNTENRTKKRWYFLIGGALLALVILIVVLILTFTLHRSDAPVQTTWLNITGFPPIPTGIATVAQPEAAIEESQCVAPNTLWSCAVPKEQQASIAPNLPEQPNFRLEIRFQNGSAALSSNTSLTTRSLSNTARASAYIRDQVLQARDSFTTSLFTSSPAPPSQEDQIFLGNTTDNNTAPFQGEATPFYISFLPITTTQSTQALSRRDNSDPFPNVTAGVPPPSINPDGTATSANLLPFPSAQPLMLYNRGRNDEHYGFYTYFDRSIFLKSTDLLNSTGPDIPDNANGGTSESAADVRCTWAQTRFLVQIWTNAGNALQLLSANNSVAKNSSSSATEFNQPGSFPYPVSITLDRHGGDLKEKMIYCYGMDETEHIISSAKQVHLEKRDFGGQGLINPGNRLFGPPVNASIADGGPGGIDGGFGGCRCQWRNWIEA